jgi:hypothetical protein
VVMCLQGCMYRCTVLSCGPRVPGETRAEKSRKGTDKSKVQADAVKSVRSRLLGRLVAISTLDTVRSHWVDRDLSERK